MTDQIGCDMYHQLLFPEYFQTCRDYIIHLQHLWLLMISAYVYLFYTTKNDKCRIILIGFGFSLGIINLIIGLMSYKKILSMILAMSRMNPDLTQLGEYIDFQFYIGLINLFIIIYVALGKYKNEK